MKMEVRITLEQAALLGWRELAMHNHPPSLSSLSWTHVYLRFRADARRRRLSVFRPRPAALYIVVGQ